MSDLLSLPPEVANLVSHEYIHEWFHRALPTLARLQLVSLLHVLDLILASPELRAQGYLPLRGLERWALAILRIR